MTISATASISPQRQRLYLPAGFALGTEYHGDVTLTVDVTSTSGVTQVIVDWKDGNVETFAVTVNHKTFTHQYVFNHTGTYQCGLGHKLVSVKAKNTGGETSAAVTVECWLLRDHMEPGIWSDAGATNEETYETFFNRGLTSFKSTHNYYDAQDAPAADLTRSIAATKGPAYPKRHRVPERYLKTGSENGAAGEPGSGKVSAYNITWYHIWNDIRCQAITENGITGSPYQAWPPAGVYKDKNGNNVTYDTASGNLAQLTPSVYFIDQFRKYKEWGEPFYYCFDGEPERDDDIQNKYWSSPNRQGADKNLTVTEDVTDWRKALNQVMTWFYSIGPTPNYASIGVPNCAGFVLDVVFNTQDLGSNGGYAAWTSGSGLTQKFGYSSLSAYNRFGDGTKRDWLNIDHILGQCLIAARSVGRPLYFDELSTRADDVLQNITAVTNLPGTSWRLTPDGAGVLKPDGGTTGVPRAPVGYNVLLSGFTPASWNGYKPVAAVAANTFDVDIGDTNPPTKMGKVQYTGRRPKWWKDMRDIAKGIKQTDNGLTMSVLEFEGMNPNSGHPSDGPYVWLASETGGDLPTQNGWTALLADPAFSAGWTTAAGGTTDITFTTTVAANAAADGLSSTMQFAGTASIKGVDVQDPVPSGQTGGATISETWDSPTLAGNLLTAVLSMNTTNPNTTPPPAPTGWSGPVGSPALQDNGENIWIYYILNAASRSGTETWTLPTVSNDVSLSLHETGGLGVQTLDKTATAQQSLALATTAPAATTAATTQAAEYAFGAIANRNTNQPTAIGDSGGAANDGWRNRLNFTSQTPTSGGKTTVTVFDINLTSTGTVNLHGTFNAPLAWAVALLTVKVTPPATGISFNAIASSVAVDGVSSTLQRGSGMVFTSSAAGNVAAAGVTTAFQITAPPAPSYAIPDVVVHVAGRHNSTDDRWLNWTANNQSACSELEHGSVINGGYSSLTCKISQTEFDTYDDTYRYGALVRVLPMVRDPITGQFKPDGANPVWDGFLKSPIVGTDGTVTLIGAGFKEFFEERDEDLMWQDRFAQSWMDTNNDEIWGAGFKNDDTIEVNAKKTLLMWTAKKGTAVKNGDTARLGWFYDHNVRRFAGRIRQNIPNPLQNYNFQLCRFTGPQDFASRFLTHDFSGALNQAAQDDFDIIFGARPDTIDLELIFNAANATLANTFQVILTQLRINGDAYRADPPNWDTYTASDVVQDLCSYLGFNTDDVVGTFRNILPLWWTNGSYADLMDYLSIGGASSTLFKWGIWERDQATGQPHVEFSPWNNATIWQATAYSSNAFAIADLAPSDDVYSRVAVKFKIAGSPRARTTYSPVTINGQPPFADLPGIHTLRQRTYTVTLPDPCSKGFAQDIGDAVASDLAQEQFSGTVTCAFVTDGNISGPGGPVDRRPHYNVRAGDILRLSDFPYGDRQFRIYEAQHFEDHSEYTIGDKPMRFERAMWWHEKKRARKGRVPSVPS